jgi:LysM repeat protein
MLPLYQLLVYAMMVKTWAHWALPWICPPRQFLKTQKSGKRIDLAGMHRLKRLFYIILINSVIAVATTLTVLYFWERNRAEPSAQVTVVMFVNPTLNAAFEAGTPLAALLTETPMPELTQEAGVFTTPEPTQIIEYRVKSGDTLSKIAMSFDASIDDILRLNGLSDPDLISVGEVLFIPASPLPTFTPVPPTTAAPTITSRPVTPTPSLTPTPSPSGNPARPVIESVIAPGDLANEKIKIARKGLGELSLLGWFIEDGNGHVYTFPRLNLFEGGAVYMHSTKGLDSATDLYWGLAEPAWQPGEILILRDDQGQEQARYQVP